MDPRPRRRRRIRRPRREAAGQRLPQRQPRRVRQHRRAQAPRRAPRPPSTPSAARSRPAPATPSPSSGMRAQGIITPEMEFIAIRENMGRAKIADSTDDIVRNDLDKQHVGSAQDPDATTRPASSAASPSASRTRSPPSSSAAKSPPAAPSSPPTSITPSCEPMIIGRNFLVKINANIGNSAVASQHRGRGRKNALGHQVGRRHRHGPLHRQEHPRHPRMDPAQLAPSPSAPCPSTRPSKK